MDLPEQASYQVGGKMVRKVRVEVRVARRAKGALLEETLRRSVAPKVLRPCPGTLAPRTVHDDNQVVEQVESSERLGGIHLRGGREACHHPVQARRPNLEGLVGVVRDFRSRGVGQVVRATGRVSMR